MGKAVQIRAQFRFDDGDKSKKPYKWSAVPTDDDGNIEDGRYEQSCVNTGGQKAVDFRTVEIPTDAEEVAEISEEQQIELIGEALLKREKDAQAKDLREAYETPQQRANREKREEANRLQYLGEMMEGWLAKHPGESPDPELFMKWQTDAVTYSKE